MSFKPVTSSYDFGGAAKVKTIPDYMARPLADWVIRILDDEDFIVSAYYRERHVRQDFVNQINIVLRETFETELKVFIARVLSKPDRAWNVIGLLLQNFADGTKAGKLEWILRQGGSGYQVEKTDRSAADYVKGAYDLTERIPPVVREQAKEALDANSILLEAWLSCYGRNPDYEKTVSRCCDFLEQYIKDEYWPQDPKPQLGKFVGQFGQSPGTLEFKGDTLISPKSLLTDLMKEFPNIRGQHTAGKGRKPTSDETEFVLHTTIYFWNLRRGK